MRNPNYGVGFMIGNLYAERGWVTAVRFVTWSIVAGLALFLLLLLLLFVAAYPFTGSIELTTQTKWLVAPVPVMVAVLFVQMLRADAVINALGYRWSYGRIVRSLITATVIYGLAISPFMPGGYLGAAMAACAIIGYFLGQRIKGGLPQALVQPVRKTTIALRFIFVAASLMATSPGSHMSNALLLARAASETQVIQRLGSTPYEKGRQAPDGR